MAVLRDEEVQLQHLEEDLVRRFPHLPRDTVHSELRRCLVQFQDAHVRTFVPVLVQRGVVDRLKRRSGT